MFEVFMFATLIYLQILKPAEKKQKYVEDGAGKKRPVAARHRKK